MSECLFLQISHLRRSLFLHLVCGMGVGGEGESSTAVAQHAGYGLDIDSVLQGKGREGVPEVMESELTKGNIIRFVDPLIGYGFSLLVFDRIFVTIGDAEEVFVDRIMGYESSNICECACIDASFLVQFPFGAAISIFALLGEIIGDKTTDKHRAAGDKNSSHDDSPLAHNLIHYIMLKRQCECQILFRKKVKPGFLPTRVSSMS